MAAPTMPAAPAASGNSTSKVPSRFEDQSDDDRKKVEKIRTRVKRQMEPLHKQYRDRWDELDALYHTPDTDALGKRNPPDRDRDRHGGVILDRHGKPYKIPVAYATIETILPRILSSPPTVLAKPLDQAAVEFCRPIADLINQQQRNMNYELLLQPTVRRALKFGLGVQKVTWCEEKRNRKVTVPADDGKYDTATKDVVEYAGPKVESVDIYDWFWDPNAQSVETCEDIMHRTWRPFSYVKQMVESEKWRGLDLDAVEKMGTSNRQRVWEGRYENQGLSMTSSSEEGRLHEVWEYHEGGEHITTILDDTFIVVDDETPYNHRRYPFQIFRPTIIEGQLPGKGEIEPLKDLIQELWTMRRQRRDNAEYVVNRVYAYSQGAVAKKDLKFGPGSAIPVRGDVREALQAMPVDDLPASSFQEEVLLKQDLEQVSGISESQMGAAGSGQTAGTTTATGMQLVQQAANARISGVARLMLLEMQTPTSWQFLELNRQELKPGEPVRIDDPSVPQGWRFLDIDAQILNANVELIPEEHSTEPENRVQRVNDAMTLAQVASAIPDVDERRVFKNLLEVMGHRDAETWFVNQNTVPPEAVAESMRRMLVQGGMPEEEAANYAMQAAQGAQGVAQEMKQMGGAPPDQQGAAPDAQAPAPQPPAQGAPQ